MHLLLQENGMVFDIRSKTEPTDECRREVIDSCSKSNNISDVSTKTMPLHIFFEIMNHTRSITTFWDVK